MIKERCKKCGVSKSSQKEHVCKTPWNKGLKGKQTAWNKGRRLSTETKNKLSLSKKGKKQPNLSGKNNGMYGEVPHNKGKKGPTSPMKGKKISEEIRNKISGHNHYNWKGGNRSVNSIIRKCYEYRQWVQDIFKRDNYTCQECGKRGVELNAHHIKQFALILKEHKIQTLKEALICHELWNYENGQTLCVPCHRKTDSYLKKLIK